VFRKLQDSALLEMTDEALHVKLVIGITNLIDPANMGRGGQGEPLSKKRLFS